MKREAVVTVQTQFESIHEQLRQAKKIAGKFGFPQSKLCDTIPKILPLHIRPPPLSPNEAKFILFRNIQMELNLRALNR